MLVYGKASGRLLAPDSDKCALSKDRNGRPCPNINSTTIMGCNPPNLTQKQPGDLVRLTFDVTDLDKLTTLCIPGKSTLNVYMPFVLIAAATGQHNLVPSLRHLLASACKFFQLLQFFVSHWITSVSSTSSDSANVPC